MKRTPREIAEQILRSYRAVFRMNPPVECVPEESTDDVVRLAVAYLAEHPADDDEPVTPEWCDTFRHTANLTGSVFVTMEAGVVLIHCEFAGRREYFCNIPTFCRTRGDVRRLLTAMGIKQVKP